MCRKLFRTVWFSFLRLLIDKKKLTPLPKPIRSKRKKRLRPCHSPFFYVQGSLPCYLHWVGLSLATFVTLLFFWSSILITLFWNSIKKRLEPQYSGQLRVGTCENRRWRQFFDEFYRHCRSKRSGRQAECRKKIHLRYYQSCWGKFTRG